ncbi:MAG: hypothetical protein INQ03_09000 [Candidatus Heimdallarchaeota archaeon]|nr:hypothetical protein [Candidatus Heimdallarchaeota archaeon]
MEYIENFDGKLESSITEQWSEQRFMNLEHQDLYSDTFLNFLDRLFSSARQFHLNPGAEASQLAREAGVSIRDLKNVAKNLLFYEGNIVTAWFKRFGYKGPMGKEHVQTLIRIYCREHDKMPNSTIFHFLKPSALKRYWNWDIGENFLQGQKDFCQEAINGFEDVLGNNFSYFLIDQSKLRKEKMIKYNNDPEFQKKTNTPEMRKAASKRMVELNKDPAIVKKRIEASNNTRRRLLSSDTDFRKEYVERGKRLIAKMRKDPDFNKKQSEAASRAAKKLWQDPEYRDMQRERIKKMFTPERKKEYAERLSKMNRDPEMKIKQKKGLKKTMEILHQDPEFMEKKRRVMQKLHQDPEFKKKQREATSKRMKEYFTDPEIRKKHGEKIKQSITPEHRERARALALRNNNDPIIRKKQLESWKKTMKKKRQDPEFVEKMREVGRKSIQKLHQDPEFRKKVNKMTSERLKEQWKDPEYRKNMSEMSRNAYTQERKAIASKIMTERNKDSEYRKKINEGIEKRKKNKK